MRQCHCLCLSSSFVEKPLSRLAACGNAYILTTRISVLWFLDHRCLAGSPSFRKQSCHRSNGWCQCGNSGFGTQDSARTERRPENDMQSIIVTISFRSISVVPSHWHSGCCHHSRDSADADAALHKPEYWDRIQRLSHLHYQAVDKRSAVLWSVITRRSPREGWYRLVGDAKHRLAD